MSEHGQVAVGKDITQTQVIGTAQATEHVKGERSRNLPTPTASVAGIFISYRREDAEGQAGRLFERLSECFGSERVFMDVTAIEPGKDFRKEIDRAVAVCDVFLALIGKDWLTCKKPDGERRLDDPKDFVRLEIAAALKRNIAVIPILVQNAAMPGPKDLPPELELLAYRNAVELRHARWEADVQSLIEVLERTVKQ